MDKIKAGDIVVCLPGNFTTDDDDSGDFKAGGSGYVEGLIAKTKTDSDNLGPVQIFWGNFNKGHGVFRQALRLATEREIQAYNAGIVNVNDIPSVESEYKISYESTDGTNKKVNVTALDESSAMKTIKDLKSLNYIMIS